VDTNIHTGEGGTPPRIPPRGKREKGKCLAAKTLPDPQNPYSGIHNEKYI
jgi:hypothetical protein